MTDIPESPLLNSPIITLDNEAEFNFKKPQNQDKDSDEIPEMMFEEKGESPSNLVDDGKMSLKEASGTSSKFVSTLLFKVAPEAAHSIIKIDESKLRKHAEKPHATPQLKDLLEEVEKNNDKHRQSLEIDDEFKDMFEGGLRDLFLEKGAEVQIPPVWRVIIPALFIVAMMAFNIVAINRENKRLERKIDEALKLTGAERASD